MAADSPPLLRFERVVKRFGGVQAVRDVTLEVRAGEILALLGENGAGKSTLIKMLAGIYPPDQGRILLRGVAVQGRGEGAMAFIHQDLGLIEWMTVAENIALVRGFVRRAGLISWRRTRAFAAAALERAGVDIPPERRVRELSRTDKSLVAIARALAADCALLVLDEPTASLPANEAEKLFAALRPLKKSGVGVIYVSHRLDEVFRIADRVAVLRDGRLAGERRVAETDADELVRLIIGRAAARTERLAAAEQSPVALSARGFAAAGAGPLDMEVRRGEMLALVGLRGAGQEAIGRALFGCLAHTGRVTLDGAVPDLSSPRTALVAGIGLISRDRTEESTMPSMSVCENIFANPAASGRRRFGFEAPRAEKRRALDIGRQVGLTPNDPDLPIEALSGGNQQKIVVGRWLATERRLLIAEDPTAGVDVGAKAEIYALMGAALRRGLAILLISTDFEEVAKICRRALVLSRGRVSAQLQGAGLSMDALIHAASVDEARAA